MDIAIQEHIVKHIQLSLAGRLDAFSVPTLQAQLDTFLKKGIKHFILDLAQVQFMDSAGLAVLVKLLKRVNLISGTVLLVMPKEEAAQRILRLTRFDQIFDIADSVEVVVSRL